MMCWRILLLSFICVTLSASEPLKVINAECGIEKCANGWKLRLKNPLTKPVSAQIILDRKDVKFPTAVIELPELNYLYGMLKYDFFIELKPKEDRIILVTAEPFEWDLEKYYEF